MKYKTKLSKKGRRYYSQGDQGAYVLDEALATPPIVGVIHITKNLENTYGTLATMEMLEHVLELLDYKVNTDHEVRVDEEY